MAIFKVYDQTGASVPETVTEDHFGVNMVTIYDEEFGDPSSGLPDLVGELGVTNLRFPGGAATEYYFDMTNPNAERSHFNPEQTLLPMDKMFEQAGNLGVSVSIVVPTRTAFSQGAKEAMISGDYGSRSEISADYLRDLNSYLSDAVREAQSHGVRLSAIELGNEFWGSGEMTAIEYGLLVAKLLPHINSFFEDAGLSTPDLIVQGTSAASVVFSPNQDTVAYIDPDEELFPIHSQGQIENEFNGVPPSNWIKVEIPGQGPAYHQVRDLVSQINDVPGSADLVSGIVHHHYVREGLSAVDDANAFMFSQYNRFESYLDRSSDLPALDFHVTEWNANVYGENARGLEHAAMMVEMFYEQVTHGIDTSQIWPLTFDRTQVITLSDLKMEELTIAGETYSLMREHLVGTKPILDWSYEGKVDIHGFTDDENFVFIASERSGFSQSDTGLNLSQFVGDDLYFVKTTTLSDGGKGGADHRASPVVSHEESKTMDDGTIMLDLDPWSLAFIEFTKIGDGNDTVDGSGNKDVIHGLNGDDLFQGHSESDRLYGDGGNDTLYGGQGHDYLEGGTGNDRLLGGYGRDEISGDSGNDTIKGGAWHDTLSGSSGRDKIFGDSGRDEIYGGSSNDTVFGGTWNDTIWGGSGRDRLYGGDGRDKVFGGNGNDRIYGGDSNDTVKGGYGDDTIYGGEGSDYIQDGGGQDVLKGGVGADHFVFVKDQETDRILDFEVGIDLLDLRKWQVDQASDLIFSESTSGGKVTVSIEYEGDHLIIDDVTEAQLVEVLQNGTLLI
ncbi:calcium-binding protein [Leisingera sp. ANG-M1]|uniref:calcium-binding protein n=1 Tax=Leisingera sp. ANG-M1 TaxID=1577895 RepID=UPI00068FA280|nr:calcium-binding protein [Leisingera sp. ANG-M1]